MPQLSLSSYISSLDSSIKSKNSAALPALLALFGSPKQASNWNGQLLLNFLDREDRGINRQDRVLGPVKKFLSSEFVRSLTSSPSEQPGSVPSYAHQFARSLKKEWADIATWHVEALVALNVRSFFSISCNPALIKSHDCSLQ